MLDELTTALDPAARRETWALMRRLRDEGLSVLLVTHDVDEAERLCDRVGVMRAGRLERLGTPQEITGGGRLEDLVVGLTTAEALA